MISSEESSSELIQQICQETHSKGALPLLLLHLDKIGFEVSKPILTLTFLNTPYMLIKPIWKVSFMPEN